AEVFEEPTYQTELLSREAKAFITRQNADRPWFLYLAFGAPHYPMMAPQRYVDRFPASMDRDRRMHAAMISAIDDGVGEVVTTLRTKGLLNNTCIYFQSDNGATRESRADHAGRPYAGGSNAPFRGWKMGLFEGGIRVPALLSGPGIPAAKVIDQPGMSTSVLPTFAAMAGVPVPEGIDGRNAAPLWQTGASASDEPLFWSYKNQRAVRLGRWKLILNPPGFGQRMLDTLWLSDLESDPGEKRNWAGSNEGVVRDLSQRLTNWEKGLGIGKPFTMRS
ncbi:MAG TPA: sulfatase-like hydrolase/transferase, partial [Bryobacteraceae bacterium]|nr:sulfatase-like hydrolase/transferase [Bryobacteraceae bacterium]